MKKLIPMTYITRVYVDSVHGSKLESVLTDAQNRNPQRVTSYCDDLHAMLRDAYRHTPNMWIAGDCVYGDITLDVAGTTETDLVTALAMADKTVAAWLRRFRIEAMKA